MKNSVKLIALLTIVLGLSAFGFALTNKEKAKNLDEKFIKGEISEQRYMELKKKYAAEKSVPEPQTKQVEKKAGNLVKNPGMEKDSNEDMMPDNWQKQGYFGYRDGALVIDLDSDVKRSGNKSLCFTFPSKSHHGGISQVIKIEPGKKYLFGLWLKGENLKGGDAFIMTTSSHSIDPGMEDKGTSVVYKEFRGNEAKGSFDWRRMLVKTKTLPENAKYLRIYICNYQADISSKVWIDDVVLLPLD